jgi:hypothetical protein
MSAASPLSGIDRPVVEINNAVKLTGRICVAAFAFSSAARLHCRTRRETQVAFLSRHPFVLTMHDY